jgi:hypothetical protein
MASHRRRGWTSICSLTGHRVCVSALAVLLADGCAEQALWVKADATHEDFARDSYACERDMRQSGYFGTGIYAAIAAQDFAERCMVARGWSKQVSTT